MTPIDAIEGTPSTPATPVFERGLRPGAEELSPEAQRAVKELKGSVGRRDSIPVRRAFLRAPDPEDSSTPLLQIYRGGQGGRVAILLYLALIWKSAAEPFESHLPAAAWAELLNLHDPERKGARRIQRALQKLQQAQLIATTRRAGLPPSTKLLREDGSGASYTLPYAALRSVKKDPAARRTHLYFQVPDTLWSSGLLQALPGPSLVMLLILIDAGALDHPEWFSITTFKQRYGLSDQTKYQGLSDLVARKIITETTARVGSSSQSKFFDPKRRRHRHQINDWVTEAVL